MRLSRTASRHDAVRRARGATGVRVLAVIALAGAGVAAVALPRSREAGEATTRAAAIAEPAASPPATSAPPDTAGDADSAAAVGRPDSAAAPAPDTALRIVVVLDERRLHVLRGADTLRSMPVGVGMDSTLAYEDQVWDFRTPRGVRRVTAKSADPVWVPPDWHYVETAHRLGLPLARIPGDEPLALANGDTIAVRDGVVGLIRPGVPFTPFAEGEEIVWEGTLYVPPFGSVNRRIRGELGTHRLDLGDGYLLHGTPHEESVGQPSSHGCLRLAGDDIAWLYERIPVGTRVVTR